jgi:hypothetical protein
LPCDRLTPKKINHGSENYYVVRRGDGCSVCAVFRGALQSGDLPAKSGAAELRELGFAETRHTATEYQKENYFTFLTAEGQEFAIKHLVNTRFGVPGAVRNQN